MTNQSAIVPGLPRCPFCRQPVDLTVESDGTIRPSGEASADDEFERMTRIANSLIGRWKVSPGRARGDETPADVYLAHAFLKYAKPSSTTSALTGMSPLCEYHRRGELELPDMSEPDACVACHIAYLEAQEGLLEQAQQRAARAEDAIKDMERPLDAQMARLNAEVVRLNGENELLRARSSTVECRGVYVASRVSRAEMWKKYRAQGRPIVSSWIDEAGEGETDSFRELWSRLHYKEIAAARGLVFYGNVADAPWKGALVEVGIALGAGKPVAAVIVGEVEGRTYRPVGSWIEHPGVRIFKSVSEAFDYIECDTRSASVAREEKL